MAATPMARSLRAIPTVRHDTLEELLGWTRERGLDLGPLATRITIDVCQRSTGQWQHRHGCGCKSIEAPTELVVAYAELVALDTPAGVCLTNVPVLDPEVRAALLAGKQAVMLSQRRWPSISRFGDYKALYDTQVALDELDRHAIPAEWESAIVTLLADFDAATQQLKAELDADPLRRLVPLAALSPICAAQVRDLPWKFSEFSVNYERVLLGARSGYGPQRIEDTGERVDGAEDPDGFRAAWTTLERFAEHLDSGPDVAVLVAERAGSVPAKLLTFIWPELARFGEIAVIRMPRTAAELLTVWAAIVPAPVDELTSDVHAAEALQVAATLWRSGPMYDDIAAAWQAAKDLTG